MLYHVICAGVVLKKETKMRIIVLRAVISVLIARLLVILRNA